jgi:flagellar biosynthesis protein FlhG
MGHLDEQTHYEVLEIPADAPPAHIERAYRIARATYQPTSAATYSLLTEEEVAEALRRVEGAYAVLSDARLRKEYDARLRLAGMFDRANRAAQPPAPRQGSGRPIHRSLEPSGPVDEAMEPEDGVYDGEVLRRIRMGRGIELEEVANITKIGMAHLRNIEANRYELLPAQVYLRGFLREIARCLRVDATAAVESYMLKLQAQVGSGPQKPRPRGA